MIDTAVLEHGRRLFQKHCYFCHGYNGDAKTVAARFLRPQPVDFTRADPNVLTEKRMLASILRGRPGTAMVGFRARLSTRDATAIVAFIRHRVMTGNLVRRLYHDPAYGWLNHERYADAFPFALGDIPLDTPWESLTPSQKRGKRLYMNSCISCHDNGRVIDPGPVWRSRAVSYPRPNTVRLLDPKGPVDAVSSATPYAKHEQKPQENAPLTRQQQQGKKLFEANCAFCHAMDGSGRNWIGSFLDNKPANLPRMLQSGFTKARLRQAILNGVTGTTMPAWKDVLSRRQVDAVVAYLVNSFQQRPPRAGVGSNQE